MGFEPGDWRRVADLITVSAMHQQFADGDRIGAYPDSITDLEKPNPAYLNPEDIMVNVLTRAGHDPDIRTVRLAGDGPTVVVSSAAAIEDLRREPGGVSCTLRWFAGDLSHTLISGVRASRVTADGRELPRLPTPQTTEPGWWVDEARGRTYVTVRHASDRATRVQIISGGAWRPN
jgi:hypothetical protein